MEPERIAPRRIGMLPRALAGVVAVAVEVERVVARVVEHAVEDDGNPAPLGFAAELAEIVLGTEHGVDLQVIARVVAVVARSFEDGIEVDGGDAELGESVEVTGDTLERAAVEVPGLDRHVLRAVVYGRLVPVFDDTLANAGARLGYHALSALAPCRVAAVAVGEDLVDHTVLIPRGTRCAVLVDGDLK